VDAKAISKLETYLRQQFSNPRIRVVARPKKNDSADVYVGEDFIGVLFDDEDGDGSYNFEMSILGEDLS